MQKLTASNLVAAINQLDRKAAYQYINPTTKGLIRIAEVQLPDGPITILRWDPSKGEKPSTAGKQTISPEMIWRIANAFAPNQPINFDRVLGASYNTRSVLESLLAHTPQFHYCYPGRIENKGGNVTMESGHKHLMWTPEKPHKPGLLKKIETEIVISEIPGQEIFYEALILPGNESQPSLDIDIQRRHAQIQIALYHIGRQLNFRTWIAQNDKGIVYQNKKIGEYEGVVASLGEEKLMAPWENAIRAALHIDCIWFKNGTMMPAVMEVEHSTGVTSGLTRMLNFKQNFIALPTRYVIVADDSERKKVIVEANKIQFAELKAFFFPYSAVEELFALCQRRKLKGVTDDFLDCYMETIVNS